MVAYTILAGGYTSFITALLFQTSPPSLSVTTTYQAGSSPSWMELSPINRSVVYATNEVSRGSYLSFMIGSNGALQEMSSVSSNGNGPAFATPLADGTEAIVLNYNSGTGEVITMETDLVHFSNNTGTPQMITFTPPPGGVSHPHFALQYNAEIFVVDLGSDKVWRMSKSSSTGQYNIIGYLPQPTGSGPRRAALSTTNLTTLYVLHETANTLTQQSIPTSTTSTTVPIISTISILPSDHPNSTFGAGELLLPTPNSLFPTEYLYASNRNTGSTLDSRGDTIAIFATNPLRLVNQVYTGLNQIRGMEFGGTNNEYLVVGGLTGGGVTVFQRTNGGANLTAVATTQDGNAQDRSTFVWL